ncbi:MAG: alpha/beta fold hydrolase [Nannocystaceae bacterium]
MQPPAADATPASQGTFLQRRAEHPTALRHDGPSTGPQRLAPAPAGAQQIAFDSGALTLAAWLALPPGPGPHPALVYLHGGFSLAPSDFEAVRGFVDAGWVVMTPALRGENGNPGRFELLWGELDDAVAAIQWISTRDEVDPRRIHVAGHSVGGGLAALVSLRPDAPVRSSASIGGLYEPSTFGRWARSDGNAALVRFDPADREETELRVLGPHLAQMVHPHVAYIGRDDTPFLDTAARIEAAARQAGAPLQVVPVAGDHEGSRDSGLVALLQRLQEGA